MEKKRKVVVLVLVGVVVALSTGMLAAQSDKTEVSSVIIPALENASVSPMKGNWSDYFNYSVNVRFYERIEIELWIYHPAEHDWISCGIREYNKSEGGWQTLWWNMTLFSQECKGESSSYKFTWNKTLLKMTLFSQECKGESSSYKFTWNKTLLKMDGKARFFGPRISDGYKGEPKPKVNFKPASVEPEIGSSETRYIYSVTMTATKKGIICLEIQSPMGGYFKPVGCYDYNRIDESVPYKWNVTSEEYCDKEIGKCKYRFYFQDDTGTKISSKVYEGPEVIIEQFTNFSVNPDKGLNSTFFNFTADLNTTKEGNTTVTLQVRSAKAGWIDVTNKSYKNDGKSIPITFNICINTSDIPEKQNLISEWRKNEVIEWRVKGLINESSTINTTYDIGLTWQDPSFSQEEGWWNDTFNFSVNVNAEVKGEVELKVRCKDWKSVGNWSYNNTPNPQTLSWEGVRVCEERYEGSTSYNFTFHCGDIQYPSPTYDGLEVFIPLNLSLEKATVEPEKGGYYNFTGGYFRNTTKPLFDYSIEVTADKPTTLKLVLIDPDGDKHEIEEKKCEYTTPPGQLQKCSWKRIELPVIKIGMWKYTFKYYDTRYGWKEIKKTFEGPEMIAVFENYTVDPDPYVFGDLVDVTVCMNGTEAMSVTLEAFNLWPDQMNWTRIGKLKSNVIDDR
jgi:hypothetical protein